MGVSKKIKTIDKKLGKAELNMIYDDKQLYHQEILENMNFSR